MLMNGSVTGGIELVGGGSDVTITPTLESGTKIADFSIDDVNGVLYAPSQQSLTAQLPLSISDSMISIDLSDYMTESEIYTFFPTTSYVNNMFQSMSRDLQENYQKKLTASSGITIDVSNNISTSFDISDYQPKLTAGDGIDITNNVISATGGGGAWDLPTDGTPLEIGTFGNMTLYLKAVSVSATNYALTRIWTGVSGDIVLLCNCVAYPNGNPPSKIPIPFSGIWQGAISWNSDDYEALPHMSVYSALDGNMWRSGATIKGVVMYAHTVS